MRNHKNTRLYSDVRTVDYSELLDSFGSIDVVIGGPPCQGFSNANRQHTTIVSMNNHLVKEFVRAVCELRPKAFVMENVPGLVKLFNGKNLVIINDTPTQYDNLATLVIYEKMENVIKEIKD